MVTRRKCVQWAAGRHACRRGFTLIEMLIVITIVGLMAMVAAPSISRSMAMQAVTQGRDLMVWMSNAARSSALERGEAVAMVIDPQLDAIEIRLVSNDSVLQTRSLDDDQVDVQTTSGATLTVCYAARGWALIGTCSDVLPDSVTFSRGGQVASARIKPLGQVEP